MEVWDCMDPKENEVLATNDPVVMSSEIAEELDLEVSDPDELASEQKIVVEFPELPEDLLTNETYINGIDELVNKVDPYSVNEEVQYVDYGTFYSNSIELPDHAVVYDCNGQQVVFPSSYSDQIFVVDGMLVNLGSNYTAGLLLDGYSVNNYLSSEVTIPTYHSSTWYQYMQTYGQPYRVVDRYVSNYGSISSSTRDSVFLEWSGGNPWEGFTFDRIALFMILALLAVIFFFRKGR